MKRFFGIKKGQDIIIDKEEYQHLKKVLRMKIEDELIVCLNDENDYYCKITDMFKDYCCCKILKIEKNTANPKKNITLFQMLPKKEYIDNIIPKSIELGVSDIYFFTSEWTILKNLKEDRVKQQIMTACKQCERSKLLKFNQVISFDKMLQQLKIFDLIILPYENENIANLLNPDILKNKNNIAVIIGNEAGFTEKEANILRNNNAQSISLGPRILRCDTAVITTVGLISILSGN